MKPLYLFLFAFALLVFTTCRRDENLVCTDKNTYQIDQAALDYFFFKSGSWWVYKEKRTGELDSIWAAEDAISYVKPPNSGKRGCKCGWGKCVEEAHMIFENKRHNKKDFNDYLYGYFIGVDLYNQATRTIENSSYYFSPDYHRWIIQNGKFSDPEGEIFVEVLDTFTVLGRTYSNLLHSWYESPAASGDWLHEAWYAKNIHLVKFIKKDRTEWELVKYNTVQ